jgi:L,D-transpeptidase ErfK/SrfK
MAIMTSQGSPVYPGFVACLVLCLLALAGAARAASYPLPSAGNQLVGEIQYVKSRADDTLLDIARRYDLGYNEITAANPQVDPWLPGEGTDILLPTRFILPQAPRQGLVVNLAEMRLYYFPAPQKGETPRVITHPLGIGSQGRSTPVGDFRIMMKIEHPSWTIPENIYAERLAEGIQTPRVLPPGPDNPLGEYAMMLNGDGLFIHGTNKPYGIGMRVSHGCLRLYPEDIRTLVHQVPKGTAVHIVDQPYKFGKENGEVYLEAHQPVAADGQKGSRDMTAVVAGVVKTLGGRLSDAQWDHIMRLAGRHTGVPTVITRTRVVSSSPAP